ncbi:rhamnulokinase [Nakamurella silvestris]|nr:rhamnulokinase [Nakamurella silvestris]
MSRHRRTVAAVDLGAESGRVASVSFDGRTLDLDIVHRFTHAPAVRDGILRWDTGGIFDNILAGLATLSAGDLEVSAVGVDSWGVDYGLLAPDGSLVDGPTCYRDPRQARALARAVVAGGSNPFYDLTGVQVHPINTVFGLLDDAAERPDRLEAARTVVMMPDVFHHLLSGSTVSEYTAVSTSGLFNVATNRWATELLDRIGLPGRILPEVVPPGTDVGPLLSAGGRLGSARVVLPASHDTASAVVAVPYMDPGAMFISSGTWSLVGIETRQAVITGASRRANLTNEGGYGGTVRLLRNVTGLWLLQECRRQWIREGVDLGYAELSRMAAAETGFRSFIDADAPEFLGPGDMPARIRSYCARTGSVVPEGIGAVARCVLDSLALSYRRVLEDITEVTGTRPPSISVVGGGANNTLLSQLTADATGLPVYSGPVEATALGNGAVQLAALGELTGPEEIRQVIAAGTEVRTFLPRPDQRWDEAAARLRAEITRTATAVTVDA